MTNKVGRPSKFTKELADAICERLAIGESMRTVCKDEDMPSMSTVFKWLREDEEFSQQYKIAKDEAADAMAEDCLHIADNEVMQPLLVDGVPLMVDGEMVLIRDAVSVNHAKLRIDTRKWYSSKLKPKKYGDKLDLSSDDGSMSPKDMPTRIELVAGGSEKKPT